MIGFSPGHTARMQYLHSSYLHFRSLLSFLCHLMCCCWPWPFPCRARLFYFALVCAIGSVLGGMLGYLIGYQFMEVLGNRILSAYGLMDKWDYVGRLYNEYAAWAVGIAGFTPIPYKVFTIAGGAFKIDFPVFVLASFLSRSARFFLVAALIYYFGPPIKTFIDKYFNVLAIVFVVLLVGGFVVIKYVMK